MSPPDCSRLREVVRASCAEANLELSWWLELSSEHMIQAYDFLAIQGLQTGQTCIAPYSVRASSHTSCTAMVLLSGTCTASATWCVCSSWFSCACSK